jgi:hypothetical protein
MPQCQDILSFIGDLPDMPQLRFLIENDRLATLSIKKCYKSFPGVEAFFEFKCVREDEPLLKLQDVNKTSVGVNAI